MAKEIKTMKTALVEKIKLGALSIDGNVLPFPKKPWGHEGDYAPSSGDIPKYEGGAIEIADSTDSDALISWGPVEHDGKELLIADRNLLTRISWDQLNEQGLIFGKEVVLGGRRFKLRVLTGGDEPLDGDHEFGGIPQTNEWDTFISNLSNYDGLPKPNEADVGPYVSEESFQGDHNEFWNWAYTLSWCQETYHEHTATRVLRGYISAGHFDYNTATSRNAHLGWRPVLEALDSGALTSGNELKRKLKEFTDDELSELIHLADEELKERQVNYRITEWIENTFEVIKSDLQSELSNILTGK